MDACAQRETLIREAEGKERCRREKLNKHMKVKRAQLRLVARSCLVMCQPKSHLDQALVTVVQRIRCCQTCPTSAH